MKERWKGVRPVRFREEIYGLLQLVVDDNKGVTIEDLRNCALKLRLEREDRRLKTLQKTVTLEDSKRRRPKLLTKVEQMIRVFRRTGLIKERDGVFWPTEYSRRLISIKKENEIRADAYFLTQLVNSGFETYWMFLTQLHLSKEVRIPSSIPERDVRLREFISSEGFPLDAWSFFILRDLFHDFSLLNYIIEEESQVIFPLYVMEDGISETSKFRYKVEGPGDCLYFWPRKTGNFVNGLVDIYLSQSENKWNRMIDLITLRERYSYKFGIPERQFDQLLQKSIEQETRYKIILSVGQLDAAVRSTAITKALTLPYNKIGLPYSMIRIGLGED